MRRSAPSTFKPTAQNNQAAPGVCDRSPSQRHGQLSSIASCYGEGIEALEGSRSCRMPIVIGHLAIRRTSLFTGLPTGFAFCVTYIEVSGTV